MSGPGRGGERRTVRELLTLTTPYLAGKGADSPRLDAELLLAHVLELDRLGLFLDLDRPVDPQELEEYRNLIRRRSLREPISQILERKEFYGRFFRVTPAVLTPRPETEHLVEAALELLGRTDGPVVEVGVGSGCVTATVALESPEATVLGTELSPPALAVARENLRRYELEDRVRLLEGDLLEPLAPELRQAPAALLLSNPPYIPTDQIDGLSPEVARHEPRRALDGGADGLDFYRRLAREAPGLVSPEGALALEVGAGQADAVIRCLAESWPRGRGETRRDLAGHHRIVIYFPE